MDGISGTLPAAMTAEDSASSTTKSGISAGTIIITDKDKHQQLTGQTAETTIANLNRDVETGKDTTNALTPIFDKDEIQAGFDIVQGLTREVGTFLENRARESTKAEEELEAELKKPKDQQDQNKIAQLTETLKDNETWGMGGTGRQILAAVTLAASGNVTGTGAEFIQSAAINYFQSLAVEEVKNIVDNLQGVTKEERETVRAALQGLTGCGGAAAQGQDCGTAAMGAASSVVLNNVLDRMFDVDAKDLTPEQKEARMNLVSSIIAGITQQAGGDAAVANAAAQMETQNNSVKLITTTIKVGNKAYGIYRKNGKITLAEIGKIVGDEAQGIASNIATLTDGELNFDDVNAALDLGVGFNFEDVGNFFDSTLGFLFGDSESEVEVAISGERTPSAGAPMPPEDEGDEGKNDAKRSSSQYEDITKGRSDRNIQTDLTREEFEQNLINNGFSADPKGGKNNVTVYTKDNTQYTVRDNATSTGGPSVDYRIGGKTITKIRLK